jgi:hypothetical protein
MQGGQPSQEKCKLLRRPEGKQHQRKGVECSKSFNRIVYIQNYTTGVNWIYNEF